MISVTPYPTFAKTVLDNGKTGIMISTEYYTELSGKMNDEQMFEFLREE